MQGSAAGGLDSVFVEELRPQDRDALRVRVVESSGCCVLSNCAGIFFGGIAQCMECAVHGTVGGNFVGRQPRAVHVAIKIVLGAHGAVHVRGFEDACEQCVRHAITVGCFGSFVRGLGISPTRQAIYVRLIGRYSWFLGEFWGESANGTFAHAERAHLCIGQCEFVQMGMEGAE